MSRYVPTYAYEFDDQNIPQVTPSPLNLLAYHTAELLFTQQQPAAQFNLLSPQEKNMSSQMISLWDSFAQSGVPTAPGTHWPAYDARRQRVLSFNPGHVALTSNFAADHHCTFWEPYMYGS